MQEVNMENENVTDTMEQAPAAEADVQAPAQEQPQPAREPRRCWISRKRLLPQCWIISDSKER